LKYFLKRWGFPLLGGVLFFGGLLVAHDLVQTSRDIFAQGAPVKWLVPIILTSLPETFAMVLPMAAILGGLVGTQQLSEGSEMVASQGLGVGLRSILKPWALLSVGLVLVASVNAHLVVPKVSSTMNAIQSQMIEETKTRFLRPGAAPFFPPQNPETGIWVAPNGQIHLFEVSATDVQHLVAKDLNWQRQDIDIERPSILLNLKDLKGCHYEKSNQSVGLLDQKSQSLRIDLPSRPRILPATPDRYRPTSWLIAEKTPDSWIELARRATLPFSAVALLLLGIALGLEHPRFRTGGALLKSLGGILAYYMVMKYIESRYSLGGRSPVILFLPPLLFFLTGFSLLLWKMRPHRSQRPSLVAKIKRTIRFFKTYSDSVNRSLPSIPIPASLSTSHSMTTSGVLGRWAKSLWWKNWGAAMGTLLTLDLLMEFVPLAGDLSKNGVSIAVFIKYWVWNLPTFLAIAFPISFLLGGVMAFSEAAISREWVAMRAGGASLLQWVGKSFRAWGSIILVTFIIQAIAAPAVVGRADDLYRMILHRPQREYQTKPWMHLTSTGVLWFLDRGIRWGFPLKPPGEAPILLRWNQGDAYADALPWDSLHFNQGPEASRLFPSKALRRSDSAEETSTLDLFNWQKWAPDPERATMLWSRLFNWLAGPLLMFALLAHTFPTPRSGRSQVLGASLVVGLLFLGMQALFGGAARAGEIPALWGVVMPLLVLLGYGFYNLHRLKT
jgi:lipopolysaccharide export LptBFGC system permease protein LptF